jgi:hypothetical protein
MDYGQKGVIGLQHAYIFFDDGKASRLSSWSKQE